METWSLVYHNGGKEGCRGLVKSIWYATVGDECKKILCPMRACAFYKDDKRERIRCLGIGGSIRRLACRCGTLEMQSWNKFYTSMHPTDAQERATRIGDAEARLAFAQQGHQQTVAAAPGSRERE